MEFANAAAWFMFGLLMIGMILGFVSIMLGVIEQSTLQTYGTRQVSCFDKNGNVINNVTCTENLTCGIVSTKWFHDCRAQGWG